MSASLVQATAVTVHPSSRVLEVGFEDGRTFRIPFELLRVHSPSAEPWTQDEDRLRAGGQSCRHH